MIDLDDTKFKTGTKLAQHVVENGKLHESRIGSTWEILNATVSVPSGFIAWRPGMARKLGMVEILQFISGYFNVDHINLAVPKLQYEYTIQNAYGIKVAQQLPKVIQQLKENPDSRRATLYIGKPEDGRETEKPCMQMVQFQIRETGLYTSVFARSWDAVSGLPYDLLMFNGVTQIIANLLGVNARKTTVHASSLHVYKAAWLRLLRKYPMAELMKPAYNRILMVNDFHDLEDARSWAIWQLNNIESWKNHLPEGIHSYVS